VPGRLHPAPGLIVGERVVELDRAAQVGEGRLVISAPVISPLSIASATSSKSWTVLLCTSRLSGTRCFASMNAALAASAWAMWPGARRELGPPRR
jgi:hypothetical protein